MNDNLNGKTIIVAGGNGLIGSAIVEVLNNYGVEVVCADIRGNGEYLNLSDQSSLNKLLEKYYPIDGFVDCTYPRDTKTATESWVRCIELVAKEMSLNGGSIVTFSSIYGLVGPYMDLYDFTSMDMPIQYSFNKGGVIAATRAIATKYGKYFVRCNAVCPGGVYHNQPKQFVERYEKRVPMGRMALPEDVAGTVLFLVSDWSKYVTGQVIAVDGGLTSL